MQEIFKDENDDSEAISEWFCARMAVQIKFAVAANFCRANERYGDHSGLWVRVLSISTTQWSA